MVLKADIECCIRMRCERHPRLANNVLRPPVFIAHRIFDLIAPLSAIRAPSSANACKTYMHVDLLPITLLPVHNGRHQHQRILTHEIPYASFVLGAVACVCCKVEFERAGEGKEEAEEGECVKEGMPCHNGDQFGAVEGCDNAVGRDAVGLDLWMGNSGIKTPVARLTCYFRLFGSSFIKPFEAVILELCFKHHTHCLIC